MRRFRLMDVAGGRTGVARKLRIGGGLARPSSTVSGLTNRWSVLLEMKRGHGPTRALDRNVVSQNDHSTQIVANDIFIGGTLAVFPRRRRT